MATLTPITDAADPRLADYRDLRDVELRKHLESEHGLFLAEGEKVVRRAVEAGFTPRSFLMAERWLDGLDDVLVTTDAPCFVLTEALAEEVTGFHVHRGALASLERRLLPTVAEVLAGARSVLVLEDIVDHTNVGAIFRSGAALGFDAVLLAPRCADPFYRRAIKVGMGAVFTMPWTRLPDWYDALPALTEAGFTTVALTLAARRRTRRGRRSRRRPVGPRARLRGPRPEHPLGAERRPPGRDPHARGHRLAQRRRRHRRRLLRRRASYLTIGELWSVRRSESDPESPRPTARPGRAVTCGRFGDVKATPTHRAPGPASRGWHRPLRRSRAGALPHRGVEHQRPRGRGVERAGAARHRDAHHLVARLDPALAEPVRLVADDQHDPAGEVAASRSTVPVSSVPTMR